MRNRKKTLLLRHACLLSKNNLEQKTSKSDDQKRSAPFLYLLPERTQVLITFQHDHITQRLIGRNSVGSKTKSIRLRPNWPNKTFGAYTVRLKLRDQEQDQEQDRGRSETGLVIRPRAVSDAKTDMICHRSNTTVYRQRNMFASFILAVQTL